MISALTGLPGSGKSYQAVVNVILPALRAGRHVVTNVAVVPERFSEEDLRSRLQIISNDEMVAPGFLPSLLPGSVVVLDEVWHLWPSGLRALDVPIEQRKYLAEHRHQVNEQGDTTEIILICQDLSQIAAFARQLIETTSIATKLSALGVSKRFRVDVYQGAVTGMRGPKSALVSQSVRSYKKKYYSYYPSIPLFHLTA